MPTCSSHPNPTQQGVGLIEVLVSLLVISIGLLGLAALQGRAQRAELESYQHAQALLLTQDMADRLRARGAKDDTEISAWNSQIRQRLIGGVGCVTGDMATGFIVMIAWQGLANISHDIGTVCDVNFTDGRVLSIPVQFINPS